MWRCGVVTNQLPWRVHAQLESWPVWALRGKCHVLARLDTWTRWWQKHWNNLPSTVRAVPETVRDSQRDPETEDHSVPLLLHSPHTLCLSALPDSKQISSANEPSTILLPAAASLAPVAVRDIDGGAVWVGILLTAPLSAAPAWWQHPLRTLLKPP